MKNSPFQPEKLEQINHTKSPFVSYLYRHKGEHGAVVRSSNEFGYGEAGVKKRREVHNGLRKAKELFSELSADYGIQTAGFYPAIGHNKERNIGAVIVSEWVGGKHFDSGANLRKEEIPAAKRLLDKLTKYLLDKHEYKEPFLVDIGPIGQYIYNPDAQDFVLVDMDPSFGEGYILEGMMLSNLSEWAPKVLSAEEFDNWHTQTLNAIKPAA